MRCCTFLSYKRCSCCVSVLFCLQAHCTVTPSCRCCCPIVRIVTMMGICGDGEGKISISAALFPDAKTRLMHFSSILHCWLLCVLVHIKYVCIRFCCDCRSFFVPNFIFAFLLPLLLLFMPVYFILFFLLLLLDWTRGVMNSIRYSNRSHRDVCALIFLCCIALRLVFVIIILLRLLWPPSWIFR